MPGRGLEPLRISPPDPTSGASANSATPASLIYKDLQISLKTENAFILVFVLELWYDGPCNAKKSRVGVAVVHTRLPVQCLTPPIIVAPSLFQHATRAIAESLDFTSAATAITRSFGLMSGTARKPPASSRSGMAPIS